jgi:sugar lactone lactonase YvrE
MLKEGVAMPDNGRSHPWAWRATRLLAAALLACAVAAGCGSGPRPQPGPHPVWPPAQTGEHPRIRHVMSIAGPADMGTPGLVDRIGKALAGTRGQTMLRPQSLAEHDKQLYVVDQELQGIHVLRHGRTSSGWIDRVGKTYFVSPVAVAWCDYLLAVSDSGLKQVFLLDRKGKLVRRIEKPGGFGRPTGLAYDARRKWLYVVDTLASQVYAFDLRTGRLTQTLGEPGKLPGQLHFPTYVALDAQGRILVADSMNFRVQAFEPDGQISFLFGQQGNASGYMAVPKGIGVDSEGHIYVADSYFSVVQIFDKNGRLLLSFGGVGQAPGEFQVPTGLMVSGNRIYVCDSQNARVQVFEYIGGNQP